MSEVQTQQQVQPASTALNASASADDRRPAITPAAAGWFGAGLAGSAVICVLLVDLFHPAQSLGSSALTGTAVLSISLVALIVLSRAVGIVQPSAALGLPNGSVRALLALGLAIVFVAVASWTLGGLFDPLGHRITAVRIPASEVHTIIDQYKGDFIVGRTSIDRSSPPEELVEVFLKRSAQADGSLDLAKQILTIAATVLVTVVGFYFGSNASSDAVRTIQATLLNRSAGTTESPFDAAAKVAREIASEADDVAKKMAALGADPMAGLAETVLGAEADVRAKASKPLSDAQQRLDALKVAQASVSDTAGQAARIAGALKADDPGGDLQAARDKLIALRAKAADAKKAFEAALAAFGEARDAVLAATSKG